MIQLTQLVFSEYHEPQIVSYRSLNMGNIFGCIFVVGIDIGFWGNPRSKMSSCWIMLYFWALRMRQCAVEWHSGMVGMDQWWKDEYNLGCPTRIITFLVGDPYKPSFATITGKGEPKI